MSEIVFDTIPKVPLPTFSNNNAGIHLYHIDCLEFMDTLCEESSDGLFDMIFADPPYFLSNGGMSCHSGKRVSVNKGDWDKSNGVEQNHEFNCAWIQRCQQLLKPNGTLWVSGTHHVIHSVGYAMQQFDMKLLNVIVWEKPNPPPNLSCRYFTHSTEFVVWAAKHQKSKHLFNYHDMREMNGGKQMKTVWTIPAPPKREKQFGRHPTQKPLALLDRIILASTNPGDVIFDPFAGSTTTGVSAIRLGRKFVGCELNLEFVEISQARVEEALDEATSHLEFCSR